MSEACGRPSQRQNLPGNRKAPPRNASLPRSWRGPGSKGCYDLPYRLHATREQFHRACPQAEEFFGLKRRYDPEELFQNQFYLKYGR